MTLVEITFELQSPATDEQLLRLGGFANTYGLRSFRLSEDRKRLTFDYDASRLKQTELGSILRRGGIAILRRIEPAA